MTKGYPTPLLEIITFGRRAIAHSWLMSRKPPQGRNGLYARLQSLEANGVLATER